MCALVWALTMSLRIAKTTAPVDWTDLMAPVVLMGLVALVEVLALGQSMMGGRSCLGERIAL